eukprot:155010-Chlamydomonas_euryale.AAC.1
MTHDNGCRIVEQEAWMTPDGQPHRAVCTLRAWSHVARPPTPTRPHTHRGLLDLTRARVRP